MKIISYDVEIKSTKINRTFATPKVYTNDLNSVKFEFSVLDMTASELTGATATTLLYMRDGSFFQNSATDVTLTGNVFSYMLKENEGNHGGLAQIQLVVKIGTKEYATQLYNFEIINGLETKVAVEVMVQDWTTLTREAQMFIDQAKANEAIRVSNETGRVNAESSRVTAESGRVSAEQTRVTAESTRAQNYAKIDERTKFDMQNMVTNGDFNDGVVGFSLSNATATVADGVCRLKGTENTSFAIYNTINRQANHRYYAKAWYKNLSDKTRNITLFAAGTIVSTISTTLNQEGTISGVGVSAGSGSGSGWFIRADYGTAVDAIGSEVSFDKAVLIDLTATFGAGKEPSIAEMDRLLARYAGAWFDNYKPIQTIETLYREKASKTQEKWITPTLLNGWTGSLQYRKNELGNVEFKGDINGGTLSAQIISLPSGYRPVVNHLFSAINGYTSAPATGYISSAGNLQIVNKPGTGVVYMGSCSYPTN